MRRFTFFAISLFLLAAPMTLNAQPLTGDVTPEDVLAIPVWSQAYADAAVDAEAVVALRSVEPGATITVVLGTWCPDSVRELAHFWRAIEGAENLPFSVEYIAVDRGFGGSPPPAIADLGIIAIPTFIVSRNGEEVGRVVETSVDGIATDLVALLSGEATGVVSASR